VRFLTGAYGARRAAQRAIAEDDIADVALWGRNYRYPGGGFRVTMCRRDARWASEVLGKRAYELVGVYVGLDSEPGLAGETVHTSFKNRRSRRPRRRLVPLD
jgi:hypothetical protein